MIQRKQVARLAWREYIPMLLTISLWATILAVLGHADTARLFAATVTVRAILYLTRISTAPALKVRVGASVDIRRQAKRLAAVAQGASLGLSLVLVVILVLTLRQVGQREIAAFLPLIAIGMPTRLLRFTDVRTDSPYYRLALAGGGLFMVAIGWAAGWHAVGIALAFGAREWIAFAVIRFWPKAAHVPLRPTVEPLAWPEIGRVSVISARRMISYRLTKIALAIFGPIGNVAARTGREMGWHSRIEPYLPHHQSGFILFALLAGAGAVLLTIYSGEPAAMIAAAGLLQFGGASTNIALLWRHLPNRDDLSLIVDDDDE